MSYIDIRDIIARIEELEGEQESFVIGAPDGTETPAPDQWAEENSDDAAELALKLSLMSDLAGYGGDEQWRGEWYPITLIPDDEFTDYCEELVSDIGGLPRDIPGYLVIDWKATANNLRVDYSEVEYEGETYLYR